MFDKSEIKIEELQKSLNYLGQSSPPSESDIAYSLFKIAVIYKDLARFDDALSYFVQSLEVNKQLLASNHPNLAVIVNNIGLVYYEEEKYDEALKYYNQSLEMFKKNEPEDSLRIATVYNNIGAVYQIRGRLIEAINCYKDSFEEYCRVSINPPPAQITGPLINMASIFHKEGKTDRALAYLKRSLEIYRAVLPPNHLDIATVLNNIGGVYMMKRKYDEALKWYNESLEIKKQTMPANHPRMAVTFDNIGHIYKALGQYDDAMKYFKDEAEREACLKEMRNKEIKALSPKPVVKHFEKRGSKASILSDTDVNDIHNDLSVSLSTNTTADGDDRLLGRTFEDRFTTVEFLAGNDLNQVYLVNDKDDPSSKKMIKMTKKLDEIDFNLLESLMSIDEANIVKYYCHFEFSQGQISYLCIITEFCQKGDLSKQIALNEKFTDREIFTWIIQVVNGLKALHSLEIIHRNIKPENILLTENDVVKLADIGIGTLTKQVVDSELFDGTRPYMSPELYESLERDEKYSYNTDIWSLGCVLYEMLFQKKAFPDGQRSHPDVPDLGNSAFFSPILRKMLVIDPEKRIDSNKLDFKLMKVKTLLEEIIDND